mgnify:CR=1 FL=1
MAYRPLRSSGLSPNSSKDLALKSGEFGSACKSASLTLTSYVDLIRLSAGSWSFFSTATFGASADFSSGPSVLTVSVGSSFVDSFGSFDSSFARVAAMESLERSSEASCLSKSGVPDIL